MYTTTGDFVAISGRRKNILERQIKEKSDNTIAFQCDIADLASFDAMLKKVLSKFGHLDLAIICAGVGELNKEKEGCK